MDNKKTKKGNNPTQCEMCAYFDYDEVWEEYVCSMNMDEDEIVRFYESRSGCPYFKYYDEYQVVRKQN